MSRATTQIESTSSNDGEPLSETETCDVTPDRQLTAEEAEQDYQNQLVLLAQQ